MSFNAFIVFLINYERKNDDHDFWYVKMLNMNFGENV